MSLQILLSFRGVLLCATLAGGCNDSPPAAPNSANQSATDASGYVELRERIGATGQPIWGCSDDLAKRPGDEAAGQEEPQIVDGGLTSVEVGVQKLLDLGFTVDGSIYDQLPLDIAQHDFRYLIAAAEAVASLDNVGPQLSRPVYRLTNHWIEGEDGSGQAAVEPGGSPLDQDRYPMGGAQSVKIGSEPVRLVLVPSPARLRATELSRIALDKPISDFIAAGYDYAFTLYFAGAEQMGGFEEAGLPMPELGRTRGIQYIGQPHYHRYVALPQFARAVVQQEGLENMVQELGLHRNSGVIADGLVAAIELYPRVYLVEVNRPGEPPCRQLVFPIMDANGGARLDRPVVDPQMGGRFENHIRSELGYDPRIGRHSLLKIPLPQSVVSRGWYPQERIVVDEAIGALSPPAAVFYRAETWQPYMPDYMVNNQPNFDADDPVDSVVLFSHILPEDLLRFLGALRGVDASPLLDNTILRENLARLR